MQITGYLFATPRPDNTIFIGNIRVHPDYQNSGLGSELMREFISKSKGLSIDLQVRVGNERAQRFYQKFGFEESSRSSAWVQMRRPAIEPEMENKTDTGVDTTVINSITPEPSINSSTTASKPISASFYIKCIAGIGSGLALVSLACVLLPPVGLIGFGIVAGYASSSIGFTAGLGLIGFFGYQAMNNKCNVNDVSPESKDKRI